MNIDIMKEALEWQEDIRKYHYHTTIDEQLDFEKAYDEVKQIANEAMKGQP